ncbi:hypothetical protein [Limosilactobacillus fermentum]
MCGNTLAAGQTGNIIFSVLN